MKSFKLRMPGFGELLRHLFLSWLLAATLEYLLIPQGAKSLTAMDAVAAMSFSRLLLVTVLCTGAFYVASCFRDIAQYERYALPGVFLVLMAATLVNTDSPAFLIICLIVLAVLTVYGIWGHQRSAAVAKVKAHWAYPAVLGVLSLCLFLFLCAWTLCRYWIFFTPTFDFGIFSQMFHSMKTTGLPITTVEREGALSHFAVHVSPIYYLMLPFYWLFPDPATLQVLQVVIILSAVIPLWLIGGRHGLSGLTRLLLCSLFLLLPAVGGGIYYDLHENCFLLPLVLWLMYAMDRRSIPLIGVFSFLTLMVKEDAAVYTAVAGLYLIVRTALHYRREYRKDLITGFAVLFGSVCYFLLVTGYLATRGDGVMTYRYQNFMLDGSDSLFSVIVAVLLCPMKMLFECVDPEKQTYIFQTLLPLLALPLMTRKFERYLLLIPYLLLNLMSDYRYQHDIFFQYNFGSTAFLLYLTAVNLADLHFPKFIPAAAAVATALFFFSGTVVPQGTDTITLYQEYRGYYDGIREELSTIPSGTSVATGTFYTAYLSKRSELYDVKYSSMEDILCAEYIVVRKTSQTDFQSHGGFESFAKTVEAAGYRIINSHQSLLIYHKD